MVRAPEGSVIASSYALAVNGMPYTSLVSLGLGLMSVWLARWAFVNEQNKRLGRRQPWRETAPLTGAAMLIAGAVIWDRQMGVSLAVFTGLGTGWSAILLLEIIGKRALRAVTAFLGMGSADDERQAPQDHPLNRAYPLQDKTPRDHSDLLDRLHDDKA